MRSILEEMWYGNVSPSEDCIKPAREAKKLMGYISNHRHDLESTFTEKQKEIFGKFDECYIELADINEREVFIYAFRLGARLMLEVMSPMKEE